MKKRTFLDYAGTTPVRREIKDIILKEASEISVEVENKLLVAKSKIANFIGCQGDELILTSSGTEGNNVIIRAVAKALSKNKKHIITSAIEHPSVINTFKQLEKEGFEVTYIKPNGYGEIEPEALFEKITEKTGLVSIMFFNNEVGSRQPIEILGRFLREKDIFFHVDGIQALYKERFSLASLPVDAMSISAHKIYGPKGIGGVYVRELSRYRSNIKQELSYSEYSSLDVYYNNVPYAIGFGEACSLANSDLDDHILMLRELKNILIERCNEYLQGVRLLGLKAESNPGILNLMLPNIDGDSAVINLDFKGFSVSTGSACSSGAVSASHVLLSMGLTEEEAKRCIRVSLGKGLLKEDIENFVLALEEMIGKGE